MSAEPLPGPGAEPEEQRGVGLQDAFRRLYTPHRMAYIKGEGKPAGEDDCPFCDIPGLADEEGLIVARGEQCFVVLNLYPYNSGHLMVVPYRHVSAYDDLTPAEAVELASMTQQALRSLRHASGPQGFNVGMNLGGRRGRRHRRPPAPARRPALGRRHQLHARRRPHAGAPAAAAGDARAARRGLVAGLAVAPAGR
jgi:ATP adenylyltransferase